jgi:hypothetical protein
MVIGNGLIANSFHNYKEDNRYLIFASGVSNSSNSDKYDFEKEIDLIKKYNNTKMTFVYFSTSNFGITPYFDHKKRIELFIQNNFESYLIFKIPNIVGFGGSENNIFNFFKKKILNKDEILVKDVYRSLIDIDDLILICENCMYLKNEIVYLSFIEKIKVIDIVNMISNELKIKPNIKIDMSSEDFNTENSDIVNDFIKNKIDTKYYTSKLIKKYINIK